MQPLLIQLDNMWTIWSRKVNQSLKVVPVCSIVQYTGTVQGEGITVQGRETK